MGSESSHIQKYSEPLSNDVKLTWEKASCESPFPGRDGHCACAVDKQLFVFGGITLRENNEHFESNELIVFDTESCQWSKAEMSETSTKPPPRSSATMAEVARKLYVFGGLSQEVGWFDDVFMYDIDKKHWAKVSTQGVGPSPRDKLASVVIGTKIYIFGGFGPQGAEEDVEEVDEFSEEEEDVQGPSEVQGQEAAQFGWFNDLFVFDTETASWSSPMQMNLGVPTPRAALAMCAIDNFLVIFGGRDAVGRQNDLHIFDTASRKWQLDLKVGGRPPEPRSFHTATAVGSRVVVLGGRGVSDNVLEDCSVFDSASRQWLQPELLGSPPGGRGLHTATVVGDRLVVYGGSSQFNRETMQCGVHHNDLYLLPTVDVVTGTAVPAEETDNQENVASRANVTPASLATADKPRHDDVTNDSAHVTS